MNRICIALSGLLSPNIVLNVMSVSAAAAVLSWKDRKFWMLWNIDLPVSHWSAHNESEDGRIRRTLFDGRQYGTKVIVHEDDVRSFLRDVRPALAHRHANIRHFQCRRVINYRNQSIIIRTRNQTKKKTENTGCSPPSPVIATTAPRA